MFAIGTMTQIASITPNPAWGSACWKVTNLEHTATSASPGDKNNGMQVLESLSLIPGLLTRRRGDEAKDRLGMNPQLSRKGDHQFSRGYALTQRAQGQLSCSFRGYDSEMDCSYVSRSAAVPSLRLQLCIHAWSTSIDLPSSVLTSPPGLAKQPVWRYRAMGYL